MTAAQPLSEIPQPAPDLRLLVELPSWTEVFFGNLREIVVPRDLPPLKLSSSPAPFWPDVFVKRELPWNRFVQSGACHVVAFVLLIGFARFFAMQPQVVARPAFDHSKVIYYQASEYLPPLDTRSAHVTQARKADPVLAPQPIISVPPEADNRSQTIVTPPKVKLTRDVALPNLLAWSDKTERPRLAIPPVPLTPAADITRIAPRMERPVVIPPPDASQLAHLPLRNSPALQTSVVAPPPSVDAASVRPLGDLNIGRSAVIAPAPQLSLAEQRADSRSRSAPGVGYVRNVVAPPPSVLAPGSSSSGSGESFGARGRVIALNLHPAVVAPPNPPPGNRRGAFAVTPEGNAGATGSPGAGNTGNSKENAGGSSRHGTSDVPSGLYVGSAAAKPSSIAGDSKSASANSVNPKLIAGLRPPRAASASARSMQPEGATRLSEEEQQVFGSRRFYSVTLNMPNLNSAGGSWVVHFAELNHDSNNHDSSNHDAAAADLSQPTATRKVDPGYPLQLMRENVSGIVILYAIIHANGTVGDVRVLRGVDDRLDQSASRAVAQWQFQPAMKKGSPVDVEATFQIPFKPSHVGTNF